MRGKFLSELIATIVGVVLGSYITRKLEIDNRKYHQQESMNNLRNILISLRRNFRDLEDQGNKVFTRRLAMQERKDAAFQVAIVSQELVKMLKEQFVHPDFKLDFDDFLDNLNKLKSHYIFEDYDKYKPTSERDWEQFKKHKIDFFKRLNI